MSSIGVSEHLLAGEAWLDARRYDEALEAAHQALASDPTNAAAYALTCRALMGMGRYPEAAQAANAAVSQAPQWALAHRLFSIALSKTPAGETQPALDQVVYAAWEAVRLAPNDPLNHSNYAEACATAGHLQVADEAIKHAIKLRPSSSDTWAAASYVAIRARNWKAAERAARRALAIDPDDYTATNNLGVAMKRQGRWNLGAVAFHGAARIDPRRPIARENVEGIGFQYMATLLPILLLPLLIFWPAFVGARIALTKWLIRSKPEKLRPLARRIGLRVATSKRQLRKYERHNERAQQWLSRPGADQEWSALRGRDRISTGFLVVVAILLASTALAFVSAATATPLAKAAVGYLITAAVFTGGSAFIVRLVVRRRRSF